MWNLEDEDPGVTSVRVHSATAQLGFRRFTPDSRWLVTSVQEGRELHFWPVDSQDLVRLAHTVAGRELNDKERKMYLVPTGRPLDD